MATTVFQVSLFSSYRFANEAGITDDRYHTVPFDDRFDPTNYFQKVQKDDTNLRVQLLSDFVPTLALYDCHDKLIKNVAFTSRVILNASFLVYDAVVDYSDVLEGAYYLKLTYTDENDVLQDLRTSPLNVAQDWPGTLLLEYTNTFNDKGVIFVNDDKSLLVFGFRIEASFDEYQPLSDDVDYIDQVHDSEVLNNTPYDNEKLYIGTDQATGGAPDWAIKKMNLIFTLNKVAIDNQYYNRNEGSKFIATRPDHGVLINGENVRPTYWSIDIIPNLNFNLQQLNTGNIPTGDLIVIKKAEIFNNVAASFSVAGKFTVNSNLIRLAIENNSLDVFTLLLGTTVGGDEIATVEIVDNPDTGTPDLTGSYDIGHYFKTPTTVFVTVPDGVNLKVTFDYNQYDAPAISPIVSTGFYPKGHVGQYWEVTEGDFALDWDVSTGFGLRNYTGCALFDGRNGLPDRSGKYSQAWNRSLPLTRGTDVGNSGNQVTLTRSVLPAAGIPMFHNSVNTTRGDTPTAGSNVARAGNPVSANYLNYELLKGVPGEEPTLGLTAKLGSGNPLSVAPDSIVDVWFCKIAD